MKSIFSSTHRIVLHYKKGRSGKIYKILTDTGNANCYCSPSLFSNKQELIVRKRVKTLNGFTIITHFSEKRLFGITEKL